MDKDWKAYHLDICTDSYLVQFERMRHWCMDWTRKRWLQTGMWFHCILKKQIKLLISSHVKSMTNDKTCLANTNR